MFATIATLPQIELFNTKIQKKMAFKKALKSETKSWMDEAPVQLKNVQNVPSSTPTPSTPQIDGERVWSYPHLKKSKLPNLNHKLPYRLEKAITRYYDFQNWFETIWMVLILNNRWAMTEVFVPEHMIKELGGSRLSFTEEPDTKTVIWKIVN